MAASGSRNETRRLRWLRHSWLALAAATGVLLSCGEDATGPVSDTTRPAVTSTAPAPLAGNVEPGTTLQATFSKPLDAATVNRTTFTLKTSAGALVAGAVRVDQRVATFTPDRPLPLATLFTAILTTGIKDPTGNALAAPKAWSFRTRDPVDTGLPVVVTIEPDSSATAVAPAANVVVTFNEAIDPASATSQTFRLTSPDGMVPAQVTASGTTATLDPDGGLESSTTYSVTLSTGIKDLTGNALAADKTWTFTTVDFAPPVLVFTQPANDSTQVAQAADVVATFDEIIDSASATNQTFTLTGPSGLVPARVSTDGATVTLNPTGNLASLTTYTATLTTGIRDAAGNALAANRTWSFTTVRDTEPPRVLRTVPADAATRVDSTANVVVTFDEPIDPGTVTSQTFTLSGPSGEVPAQLRVEGAVVTLDPDRALAPWTRYFARVTNGLQDLAGNALPQEQNWGFTTRDTDPPIVFGIDPSNGTLGWPVTAGLTVTFNEPILPASVTDRTFIVSGPRGKARGQLSVEKSYVTFLPYGAGFEPSTRYTVTVTRGVTDVEGNAPAAETTSSFTTAGLVGSWQADQYIGADVDYTQAGEAITITFTREGVVCMRASNAGPHPGSFCPDPGSTCYPLSTAYAIVGDRLIIAPGTPNQRTWHYIVAGDRGELSATNDRVTPLQVATLTSIVAPEIEQWAAAATASSFYEGWPPASALGAPDVGAGVCADDTRAWAAAGSGGLDWLEVSYLTPVTPSEIHIFESNDPGRISQVELLDTQGAYHVVYTATPAIVDCPHELVVQVTGAGYLAKGIKITVDATTVNGFDEIDAVSLRGTLAP